MFETSFDYNFLGVAFVSDDVSKKKAEKVLEKMEEIIEKYKELAITEFESFLEANKLEQVMGVIKPKPKE